MVFVARLRLIYWGLVWVEGVEGVETYGCWGGEGDRCGDEEDEDLELHFAWGVG
jgi:hypothetical protein